MNAPVAGASTKHTLSKQIKRDIHLLSLAEAWVVTACSECPVNDVQVRV
jgi:hypothetical protein